MPVQLEIILRIETSLLEFCIIRRNLEIVKLGTQGEGEIGLAAKILQVFRPGPEILPDIKGYEAAGSRCKEVAAGEIEDSADPAELVIVEAYLGKGQRVFVDLEYDPAG